VLIIIAPTSPTWEVDFELEKVKGSLNPGRRNSINRQDCLDERGQISCGMT
jgi:hypothetical protein